MNYFGLFLLSASIIVFLIPVFFPGVAPNGYEVLVYVAWGTVIFVFAMIFLVITNLFKFLSKDDFTAVKYFDENSDSDVNIIWLIGIYGPFLIGLIVFALDFFS